MLLSGVALGFSFPPFPSYVLGWIALVPLLLRWMCADSARRFYLEAFGTWGIAALISFSWPLLHPKPVTALASLGGMITLCLIAAIPLGAAVPIRRKFGLLPGLAAFVAFTLAVEWGLQHGPLAFPWMLIGHTQAAAVPFNQMAAVGGTAALSLWVLLLNCFALLLVIRIRRRLMIGLLAFLIGAPALYGTLRLNTPPEPHAATPALLVQPGLPPDQWADVHDEHRVDRLMALSDSALAHRPDTAEAPLVIWPETALPPHLAPPFPNRSDRIQRWTNRQNVALLTGAIRRTEAPADSAIFYNSAVLFQPNQPPQMYDKNRLVPFAERVPFVDALSAVRHLAVPAGGVAGYTVGTEQPLLIGPGFAAGALICFESTFPAMGRRYAHQSADFLVTLAQDGWWGRSLGYRQHFAFTRLRAIETGRAVATVTVTGITGVIRPTGQSVQQTGWMDRTARWTALPHYRASTAFTRWGDVVSVLALGATGLFVLGLGWMRLR